MTSGAIVRQSSATAEQDTQQMSIRAETGLIMGRLVGCRWDSNATQVVCSKWFDRSNKNCRPISLRSAFSGSSAHKEHLEEHFLANCRNSLGRSDPAEKIYQNPRPHAIESAASAACRTVLLPAQSGYAPHPLNSCLISRRVLHDTNVLDRSAACCWHRNFYCFR